MRSSLDSLVGQLFIIGLTGLEVDSRLEEHYSRCPSGGFILFGRNARDVGQLRKLTSALRDLASEHSREYGAPLIGIDQEGGVLSPLRDMVTSLPGNMGLAATGSPEAARYAGYVTGRDLTSLGIGLNFAPVLDLAREPLNPAIGTRSFGDEPHRVAEFGVAYANGLLDAGVLFVAKHFPGHGSVPEDSHFSLPECTTSKAELLREDLVPFREIARLPHAAMMAAHVRFPDLDPVRPASLSYPLVTRFLREELGFDGVVITDCLEMGGVRKVAEVPEAAVMAIEAGCDIVLVSHTPALQRAAFEAVRNAVSSGRISVRRVEESVATIRRWKEGLGGLALRGPVLPRTTGGLTPEDLGEQVVTFIQGDPEWPWAFGRSPLVLVTPKMDRLTLAEDSADVSFLEEELRSHGVQCVRVRCPMDPDHEEVSRVVAAVDDSWRSLAESNGDERRDHGGESSDAGVMGYIGVDRAAGPAKPRVALVVRNGGRATGQPALAAAIQRKWDLLLICVRDPREVREVEAALSHEAPVLVTYSTERVVLSALARVLAGETGPKGVIPVKM